MVWRIIELADRRVISPQQALDAIKRQLHSRPPLGELAISRGKLTMRQVFMVLSRQAESMEPFGKISVDMGFMSKKDLADLLLEQSNAARSEREILEEMGLTGEASRFTFAACHGAAEEVEPCPANVAWT